MEGFNPNDIATTIKTLVDSAIDKTLNRTYKRGVIATMSVSSQKASVYIEGNTTATPGVISLGSYVPRVGDKVLLLSIGDSGANLVILGPLNTQEVVWTAPTLLNGWVNYDAPSHQLAGYYKDSQGFVHLRGLVKNGAMPSVVFVLPVGYRPSLVEHFPSYSNGAFGGVRVDNGNGNVQLESGGNPWFSMAGITFWAGL